MGTTLSRFASMSYDGAGNRTSVTASLTGAPSSYNGTTGYTYDYGQTANPALNRSQLTKEQSTRGNYTNNFAYDGGTSTGPGNPTSFKAQTFNANNQQTGTGYGYDGNGILTFGPRFAMLTLCHRHLLPHFPPSTPALPKPRSVTLLARR